MNVLYPEFLLEMQDILADELKPFAIDFEAIKKAVERFRITYSGETLYIPKRTAFDTSQRHAEIIAEFNGFNHAALCHKYGVTERQIYRILRAKKQRHFEE